MGLFKKQAYLSVLFSSGLLVAGCGGDSMGPTISVVQIIEGPPQVTIALHSKLELDFSLDPDPQPQIADMDKQDPNAKVEGMDAKLKKKESKRSLPVFKVDNKYQSIKRYESIEPGRYAITIEKSPQKLPIRKTVKVHDKPLIFAGRGYNIFVFEKETKPAIDVDYATHLKAIYPDPPRDTNKKLDLKAGYSKDTKFLVCNSTRSAFGELPPPLIESKPEPRRKTDSVSPPERNPDSVLLFPRGEKSLLVLRKAEKHFDLLGGNGPLNKKQFEASKVSGTSKKTPNTLQ